MTYMRERWEGVSICEKYTLEQWLGGGEGAAFFQTSLPPDGRRAVVKLVPEASADDAGPLNLWHRICQLRHPHLVELLDCGRADLDGEIAFYALFESPDDTLASALSQSALSPQESREVLDAIIDALRYLHAQGLAAGALDPDHIVAVGEQVKLSTGALFEAESTSAQREDVRLLGELWQRALLPASPDSPEIAAHAADPDPETRWTLAEISAALDAARPPEPLPLPAPLPEPPPAVESAPPEPPVSEPTFSAEPVPAVPASQAPSSEPPPALPNEAHAVQTFHRRTPEPAAAAAAGFLRWMIAAAAGVVFLIIGFQLLHRPAKVATQPNLAEAPQPRETVAPQPLPSAAPPRSALQTVPKPVADDERIWRVIAFTYRSRDAAAKKAQQLNEYHPGIDAAVFLPKDRGHYYLVSLGGRMTHEQAERLQRTARGKGLPRDLYVQNYSK